MKDFILKNYEEIISLFSSKKYFANVHMLDTPSEGLCSCYYIELKPKYPNTKEEQFTILWEYLELNESPYTYKNKSSLERQEILRENFQFVLDSWNPRKLEEKDTIRARRILLECQSSFSNGATENSWCTNRQIGYYLNNKFKGSIFPHEIAERIQNSKTGLVIYDDWEILMLLLEHNNVYSLFYWFTSA